MTQKMDNSASASNDPVIFSELKTLGDKIFARATLNSPKSLNSLTLDMIVALREKLREWKSRPEVVAVWLEGAGEKAFCAGGDIVKLYEAMNSGRYESPDNFFEQEYSLDLSIHEYPKPIIVWGDGVVMGGGMGLMQGSKFRLVTERTMIAMPEITIGLYPDVGASYFLHKCPKPLGLFEALTGARLNAADALKLNFADHFVSSSSKEDLINKLLEAPYKNFGDQNMMVITGVLMEVSQSCAHQIPEPQLEKHAAWIEEVFSAHKLSHIDAAIRDYKTDDKWLSRSLDAYKKGCPASAALIFEQLRRSESWSLKEAFEFELAMSASCARSGDFLEGIRALLIDKDGAPKWKHASIHDISSADLDSYFKMPEGKPALSLKYMV